MKDRRSTVALRQSLRCWPFIFYLEGVTETEIDLDKVVRSPIDNVITGLAEDPDEQPTVDGIAGFGVF